MAQMLGTAAEFTARKNALWERDRERTSPIRCQTARLSTAGVREACTLMPDSAP